MKSQPQADATMAQRQLVDRRKDAFLTNPFLTASPPTPKGKRLLNVKNKAASITAPNQKRNKVRCSKKVKKKKRRFKCTQFLKRGFFCDKLTYKTLFQHKPCRGDILSLMDKNLAKTRTAIPTYEEGALQQGC